MRLFQSLFSLALLGATFATSQPKSYSGHKVFRVQVTSDSDAEFLSGLESDIPALDFWTSIKRQGPVDIMVEPSMEKEFLELLQIQGLSLTTMIEDVQSLAEGIKMRPVDPEVAAKQGHSMDWDTYHSIEDMYSYLDFIEGQYDYATTETIGQSYEGTDMRLMKICKDGCGNKPAMWIDGGIHAREWVSHSSVMWMIRQLTEDLAGQEYLIDQLDWYILPVGNPDGYLFTQTDDRIWRKTRSFFEGNVCIGTDANRNWDFHFGEEGASDVSCADTYHGPYGFSEVEIANVRDWFTPIQDTVKFWNSIHAYSQYVLLPWGWTSDLPEDYDELKALADRGIAALTALYGTEYVADCIPCLLYPSAGGSLDWAKGVAGVKYAYGMELRDTGEYGFLLPEDQIVPTAEETWAFHVSAANDIIAEYGN